ncbi:accessory gland-specific peptide 26Ab [Drosophila teissieri]|uniref:accessory gland-specific peptide 26Ab n=1 Tax=Drosophila teissieri TaxID=7243 RepID=UPI001CBA1311|nr:accessory gland-specific peptide 26Ab [Drosophila teissieri]
MNYFVLLGIFSCICVWQLGDAAPYISVQSSSRSSSQKMMGGMLRTLYDYNVQDSVNDLSGQLVHTRNADFNSDVMSPNEVEKVRHQLLIPVIYH